MLYVFGNVDVTWSFFIPMGLRTAIGAVEFLGAPELVDVRDVDSPM